MYYAIISEDEKDSLATRQSTRPQHLARLEALASENRLLIAGPHPIDDTDTPNSQGFSGSLVVAQFKNLQEAQFWADEDPYQLAGVYKKVTVKPFIKVLP